MTDEKEKVLVFALIAAAVYLMIKKPAITYIGKLEFKEEPV